MITEARIFKWLQKQVATKKPTPRFVQPWRQDKQNQSNPIIATYFRSLSKVANAMESGFTHELKDQGEETYARHRNALASIMNWSRILTLIVCLTQ